MDPNSAAPDSSDEHPPAPRDGNGGGEFSPALIREELERVVSGPLATSPQLGRILRFVVDESLAGRAPQLKGYTIAVHAMGREQNFDSNGDAAVRVAARQLRFKLTEYYAAGGDGQSNAIHISLPKGGYAPQFNSPENGHAPRRDLDRATEDISALTSDGIAANADTNLLGRDTGANRKTVATDGQRTRSFKRTWIFASVALAALLAVATFLLPIVEPAPQKPPVIAVLSFENLTGLPEDSLLADALSVEVASALARDPALRVVARTSTLAFRDSALDIRAIAQKLGASHVVEGTVRRDGDRYRISVAANAAVDGTQVWSEQYDIDRMGAFALHDVIAIGAHAAIGSTLRSPFGRLRTTSAPKNPRIPQLLAEGRIFWNQRTESSLKLAVQRFGEALTLDTSYAPTWSSIAGTFATMEVNHILAPGISAKRAFAAAEQAIALDSLAGEPWAAIGLLRGFHEWKWAAADTAFYRAIALAPSYATARSWYSNVLLAEGRVDAALVQLNAARELDPLSVPIAYGIAQAEYYGRRWNDGLVSVERVLQFDPSSTWARLLKGKLLKESGRREEARREFAAIPDSMELMLLDSATFRVEVPKKIASYAEADRAKSQFWIATLYARIGMPDSTFAWLERGYAARQADMSSILVDPGIDNVMRDPRYAEMVTRIGLAPPVGQYIKPVAARN